MLVPRLLFLIAAILYIASLFTPVGVWFYAPDPGYQYLLFGWMGILGGVISWYANPCLLLATILLINKHSKEAFILSLAAVILALSTLVYSYFEFHIDFDAGGTFKMPGLGYYLWLTSSLVFSLGIFIQKRKLDAQ